jgi:hypothetical protein
VAWTVPGSLQVGVVATAAQLNAALRDAQAAVSTLRDPRPTLRPVEPPAVVSEERPRAIRLREV